GSIYLPPPGPPAEDAGGYCGNLVIPVVTERPNLYFVVDASGSMIQPMDVPSRSGYLPSRFEAARGAILDLLRAVGHRVQYGAALFPAEVPDPLDVCPPGEQVFATRPGDEVSHAIAGVDGPTLKILQRTLAARGPSGFTPTAASLAAVRPIVTALPGTSYVFLLTDGAPNCGGAPSCPIEDCIPNIDGSCSPDVNCCDPAAGAGDAVLCLDADATVAQAAALRASGVRTFVIGMPGTREYADRLGDLAEAGGTARAGEPRYYPVQGADDLADTIRTLGLGVAVSCDVELGQAPPDPALVNVYLDTSLVLLDPVDGWIWTSEGSVRLVGEACRHLQAGDAFQVQVVAGCPSVVR
ncbi:MAG: VWA domain-containing protein, partial [Deltaproteobacteria bacterium]|nr:VWA domain-containing protein [Deltaproteobacteria bacterium]